MSSRSSAPQDPRRVIPATSSSPPPRPEVLVEYLQRQLLHQLLQLREVHGLSDQQRGVLEALQGCSTGSQQQQPGP